MLKKKGREGDVSIQFILPQAKDWATIHSSVGAVGVGADVGRRHPPPKRDKPF
jgi:hypothetical protein